MLLLTKGLSFFDSLAHLLFCTHICFNSRCIMNMMLSSNESNHTMGDSSDHKGTRGCLLYFPLCESSCSLWLNYVTLRRTTIIHHILEKVRIASQVHVLKKKKVCFNSGYHEKVFVCLFLDKKKFWSKMITCTVWINFLKNSINKMKGLESLEKVICVLLYQNLFYYEKGSSSVLWLRAVITSTLFNMPSMHSCH